MKVTIRGRQGAAILWGYRTVARLSSWTIARHQRTKQWQLTATIVHASSFELKQKPLLFSAPRKGGFWCWPILEPPKVERQLLTATLGPPEQ